MTDFTNFDTLLKNSQNVEGLLKIHEYILSQKQVLGDSRIISKHLKEENEELKNKFEVIEQSTESCAYMEMEIKKLNEDISLMKKGVWIGVDSRKTTLGKLDEEIDGLKKENDKLKDEREVNLVSIKKLKIEKEMLVKLSKDKLSEKKEQIEKLKVSLTKVDELVSSVLYGEGSHRCWDDGSFQKK